MAPVEYAATSDLTESLAVQRGGLWGPAPLRGGTGAPMRPRRSPRPCLEPKAQKDRLARILKPHQLLAPQLRINGEQSTVRPAPLQWEGILEPVLQLSSEEKRLQPQHPKTQQQTIPEPSPPPPALRRVESRRARALPAREAMVANLGTIMEHMVRLSADRATDSSVFRSARPLPGGVGEYVAHLAKYCGCSDECLILTLVYVDRIIKQHRDIAMAPLTCQRLLGAGLTMAVKFHDDQNYTNAYYAQVCGLELLELNNLEVTMLRLLKHRLFVRPEEFEVYRAMLLQPGGVRGHA